MQVVLQIPFGAPRTTVLTKQGVPGGSHSSPGSGVPLPHVGHVQSLLQGRSPGQGVPPVPGSHCSPLSTMPLSHSAAAGVGLATGVGGTETSDGIHSSVGRVMLIVKGPNWLLMKIGGLKLNRGRAGRTW